VTSERKISANRANARASTGPKTAEGRARSIRNARRHGLSLPVLSDPLSSQEVEELAREIAGTSANAEIHELARRIAEAQIDLRRVRHARHAFLASAIGDPDYESPSKLRTKSRIARQLARIRGPVPVILSLSSRAWRPSLRARRNSRLSFPTWVGGLQPWTATNDVRCRDASLRSGLSMRHELTAVGGRMRRKVIARTDKHN
jgi:hypothetical protein